MSRWLRGEAVCKKLREYKAHGFEIVLHPSRNIRSFNGNPGKINYERTIWPNAFVELKHEQIVELMAGGVRSSITREDEK